MPPEPSHKEGEHDDSNLYSNAATMMTEEARTLILSGDTEAGLQAYKKRMYRKIQAGSQDKVSATACRLPGVTATAVSSCWFTFW